MSSLRRPPNRNYLRSDPSYPFRLDSSPTPFIPSPESRAVIRYVRCCGAIVASSCPCQFEPPFPIDPHWHLAFRAFYMLLVVIRLALFFFLFDTVGCTYAGCFVPQTFYRTEVIQLLKLPSAVIPHEHQKVDFISWTKTVRVDSPCHPRFPHAVIRKRAPGSTSICDTKPPWCPAIILN